MKKICLFGNDKSEGLHLLKDSLIQLGAEVVYSPVPLHSPKGVYYNVGWGRSGGDLNKTLPPNKLWELQQCIKADVQTVPLFPCSPEIMSNKYNVWFGRKLKHTQGKDIIRVVGNNLSKVTKRDFWTLEIEKLAEYRVHVFNGVRIRCGTKTEKDTGKTQIDNPIWNLKNGMQIRYETPSPLQARKLAIAAVKACGLDYSAVDIIQGTDEKFYVLELNCRPGLHGNTAVVYAKAILDSLPA